MCSVGPLDPLSQTFMEREVCSVRINFCLENMIPSGKTNIQVVTMKIITLPDQYWMTLL